MVQSAARFFAAAIGVGLSVVLSLGACGLLMLEDLGGARFPIALLNPLVLPWILDDSSRWVWPGLYSFVPWCIYFPALLHMPRASSRALLVKTVVAVHSGAGLLALGIGAVGGGGLLFVWLLGYGALVALLVFMGAGEGRQPQERRSGTSRTGASDDPRPLE